MREGLKRRGKDIEVRITKISVKGLFGMFDHEIPLNQESRITIVHGPNGVGKTVLLRLLDCLFNCDYEFMDEIPFDEFRVDFEDGEVVTIKKEKEFEGDSDPSQFLIKYNDCTKTKYAPFKLLTHGKHEFNSAVQRRFPDHVRVELDGTSYWLTEEVVERYSKTSVLSPMDLISKKEILSAHSSKLYQTLYGERPEWFLRIFDDTETVSIQIQRTQDVAIIDYELLDITDDRRFHVDPILNLEPLSFFADSFRGLGQELFKSEARFFYNIVNERILFKSFELSTDGFRFVAKNGSEVPLAALSSGEQQLLILYSQLLFEFGPDTLVMIDEPELSMNVVWQRNFLKDLQRIIELRKFDVLIATHSPQIIHDKWDWMVPLGEKMDD